MKINTASSTSTKQQAHRYKTDPYYTSPTHKRLRQEAYLRDGGKCTNCGKAVSLHTTKDNREFMAVGDHIIPREAGGKDDIHNYQTLCKPCHDSKSSSKDKKYYR